MSFSPLDRLRAALKISFSTFVLLGSLMVATARDAHAQFTMGFVENVAGTETTVTYSGDWVTFGGSPPATPSPGGYLVGSGIRVTPGMMSASLVESSFPAIPWTEMVIFADSVTGDSFGFSGIIDKRGGPDAVELIAPDRYRVGDTISGSAVFAHSLADLGFDAGEIASGGSFVVVGTTINWTASTASAVPEPSSFAIMVGTLALGFASTRRRRHRAELPIA